MEKGPPVKSGSFASQDEEKSDTDHSQTPKSKDIDLKSDDQEVIVQEKQEEKENTEESSDLDDSNLGKLSEEIDQFLSILSSAKSNADPNLILPKIPSCIEKFLNLVEVGIAKCYSGNVPEKWFQDSDDDSSLLEAVNMLSTLTRTLREFHSEPQYASLVNRISAVLQRAMSFLEEEFRVLLEDYRSRGDSDPSDLKTKQSSSSEWDRCTLTQQESAEDDDFPGYSPKIVSKLKRIAMAMISSEYETECYQVYSIARRNDFEESLNKLGFEKISIDDVQKMQWESLEKEIAMWINAIKQCITIYFIGERKLCEEVFANHPSISYSIFSNLTRGIIIQLLNFSEAVAMTKKSAEKLFKFLDMYETMRDLILAMDGLFSNDLCQELKSETLSARCRLGEAAIRIFSDLENSIKSDMGKTPVPGGAVHPLTRYTMNYIKYACEYKDTLEQVFQEHQNIEQSDTPVAESDVETNTPSHNNNETAKPSPFSVQLVTVMDLLDSNLESKSKIYKDLSLSYIFLMNNGRYIMQKIKGSNEIHDLMGDTWCRKRSSDLRQYHKNYQRETWGKLLGCLKFDGLQVNGKVVKPVLKERFKSFNVMFEEIHKAQSSWVVCDEQLQSELRVSISAVIIPAYRSFLGKFRQYLDSGRQTEKYIKYGPEDIETYIDELFDGNPASMVKRRT